MWSSTSTVVRWVEDRLDVRTGTYPPADMPADFAVVQRVGGEFSYPHDSPRFSVQVWTDTEEGAEQAALALAAVLPGLAEAHWRINSVGTPSVTSIGRDASGHHIWQITFDMQTNISNKDN